MDRPLKLFALAWLVWAAGCDPADSLQNGEYRAYLDNYEKRDIAVVVAAFNQLDTKREAFDCAAELEAAQRALRREKAGPLAVDQTREVKAFKACLGNFFKASGVEQGLIQSSVISPWVNHNFLPEIQKRLDAEVATAQKRIDGAGCGGEACEGLTVVGDLIVPRVGAAKTVTWSDARALCAAADLGGLRPWRLPTKAELVAMRDSERLASDVDAFTYWSTERHFDDRGEVKAWGLRFIPASRTEEVSEPELVPFERRGVPARGGLRCVFDLGEAAASDNEVEAMEAALVDAGCHPSDWYEQVRLREGLLVTWPRLDHTGGRLEDICQGLELCELRWQAPSKAQASRIAADPWLGEGASSRCVAELPDR